jgi:hypothetical protein
MLGLGDDAYPRRVLPDNLRDTQVGVALAHRPVVDREFEQLLRSRHVFMTGGHVLDADQTHSLAVRAVRAVRERDGDVLIRDHRHLCAPFIRRRSGLEMTQCGVQCFPDDLLEIGVLHEAAAEADRADREDEAAVSGVLVRHLGGMRNGLGLFAVCSSRQHDKVVRRPTPVIVYRGADHPVSRSV